MSPERLPPATGFTQREPVDGAPSTEPTEVRIAYTPATLYIGVRARGSDHPEEPGRRDRSRDERRHGPRSEMVVSAESGWDRNRVELPAGSFTTNLFRERLQVNLTPDLSTSAFVQFSDAAELLAANLRLGWTYRPGADVFLVLNQRWDAPSLGLRTVRDRQAILKLTYLIAV